MEVESTTYSNSSPTLNLPFFLAPVEHSRVHTLQECVHLDDLLINLTNLMLDTCLESQYHRHSATVFCFWSVPTTMFCKDLLNYMSPLKKYMKHIRIIFDSTPNEYTILVEFNFKTYGDAYEFYNAFEGNLGKPFNRLDIDVCAKWQSISFQYGKVQACPCHACKKQMDESTTGIFTLQCDHSFHISCLDEWEYSICRYCKIDASPYSECCCSCDSKENLLMCWTCGHTGCGNCSYSNKHALSHVWWTNHIYSIEVETKVMWKYIKDPMKEICEAQPTSREILQEMNAKRETQLRAIAGLHEQFENQKITVSEAQIQEKVAEFEKQVKPQKKTEVTELEVSLSEAQTTSEKAQAECRKYEQMFSDSEKQRKILEKKISPCVTKLKNQEKELSDKKQINESLQRRVKEIESQKKKEVTELETSLFEAQTTSEKQRKILEKNNSQCVTKLKKELQDEKQMNECLRSNQEIWPKKVAALEKQLKEVEAQRKTEVTVLQEQVEDLMRHFETKTAIEKAPAEMQQEIQEGQLHVTVDQPGKSKKKSKKRK